MSRVQQRNRDCLPWIPRCSQLNEVITFAVGDGYWISTLDRQDLVFDVRIEARILASWCLCGLSLVVPQSRVLIGA